MLLVAVFCYVYARFLFIQACSFLFHSVLLGSHPFLLILTSFYSLKQVPLLRTGFRWSWPITVKANTFLPVLLILFPSGSNCFLCS